MFYGFMVIIVGLGNPGLKYQKTRHNIGQVVLKKLVHDFYFPRLKLDKNLKAYISRKDDILLALPTIFMNESGISAEKLIKKYTRSPDSLNAKFSNLWVVHDDLDLNLGRIKISFNSSSAGHKGVQSIINRLGSQNFVRFRIGIKNLDVSFIDAKKIVLQKFSRKEKQIVEQSVDLACNAINFALERGIERSCAKYNS